MQGHKHHRTKEAPHLLRLIFNVGLSLLSVRCFFLRRSLSHQFSPSHHHSSAQIRRVNLKAPLGLFLSDKTHTAGYLLPLHQDFRDSGPPLAATKEIDATASPPSVHRSPLLTPYLLNFHCEHYVIRGH